MKKSHALILAAAVSAIVAAVTAYPVYFLHSFAGEAGAALKATAIFAAYELWLVGTITFSIAVAVGRLRGRASVMPFHLPALCVALCALVLAVVINVASRGTESGSVGGVDYVNHYWGWPLWCYYGNSEALGLAEMTGLALFGLLNVLFVASSCVCLYLLVSPSPRSTSGG